MTVRPLNLLTVLSLLSCVAAAGLWVRGRWATDEVGHVRVTHGPRDAYRSSFKVQAGGGRVALDTLWLNVPRRRAGEVRNDWYWISAGAAAVGSTEAPEARGWFDLGHRSYSGGAARMGFVTLPLWLVCVLTAVLPTVRLCRRRRGFSPGLCRSCGYDLRATPCRCPECGGVPAEGATPAVEAPCGPSMVPAAA